MIGAAPKVDRFISTPKAPTPGAYSQAVRVSPLTHDLLFLAGQTGNVPGVQDEPVEEGGMGTQTTRALKNMLAIVTAAGGDAGSFVSMTVYLKDHPAHMISPNDFAKRQSDARTKDWQAFNEAYIAFFAEHDRTTEKGNLPARVPVWVSEIPLVSESTVIMIQGIAEVARPHVEPIRI